MFPLGLESKLYSIFWHWMWFSWYTRSLFICNFTMIFCSLRQAITFPTEGGYFFILLSDAFVTWSKSKVIVIIFGLQAYLEHTKHCVQGQQVSSDTEIVLHDLFFQNGKMHVCNLPYLAPVLWTCDWRKLWSKPSYSCFKSSSLCPMDIVGIFIELIFLGDGVFTMIITISFPGSFGQGIQWLIIRSWCWHLCNWA